MHKVVCCEARLCPLRRLGVCGVLRMDHAVDTDELPAREVVPPAAPEVGSNDTVYTTVKVKLTGRYTPIRRRPPRQLQIPAQRTDGQSAEGSEPGSADTLLTYDGDEADLSALLDQATRQAEDVHGEALRQSSAWDQLMRLLPLLTQAQAMLLVHEHSRCVIHHGTSHRKHNLGVFQALI